MSRHPDISGSPYQMRKKTDKGDWGKLKQVLKYHKVKRELKPTLGFGDMLVVKWWVDE